MGCGRARRISAIPVSSRINSACVLGKSGKSLVQRPLGKGVKVLRQV